MQVTPTNYGRAYKTLEPGVSNPDRINANLGASKARKRRKVETYLNLRM